MAKRVKKTKPLEIIITRTDLSDSGRSLEFDEIELRHISTDVIPSGHTKYYTLITFVDDDDDEKVLLQQDKFQTTRHTYPKYKRKKK